jgi:hypothetical protein
MQSEEITLAVDELNDANTVNHVYSRFEEYQNRSVYIHSGHSLEARDTLSFYRTFPKVSGNFKGMAKSAVKFSQDVEVAGVDGVSTLTSPIIVEVSFSVPVGATQAEQLIARQRAIALLDDDTIMVKLNDQLMV